MIRLACGDGHRKPESLREFAERVEAVTGVSYDHKTVGLLERDQQGWRLKDVEAFAAVDPKGRGGAWLAFGDEPRAEPPQNGEGSPPGPRQPRPDPRPKVSLTSKAEGRTKGRKR
jgi:hypothetical protein